MTDIAELGLVIRSDGVVVARNRLKDFKSEAGLAETAVSKLTQAALRLVAAYATWQVATAVIGKFVNATIESEQAQRRLETVVRSTGGAAGYTANELSKMATEMQRVSTFGDETVKSAQAILLGYGRIGREVFPEVLEAAMNMSQALGIDLTQAAERVGRAIDLPSRGMAALAQQGFFFTEEQKKLVKQLESSGRIMDAQKIVLGELEFAYGGAARAARDTLGGALTALGEAFGDLFEANGPEADQLKAAVEDLVRLISDPAFIANIQSMGAALLKAFADAIPVALNVLDVMGKIWNFAFPAEGADLAQNWGTSARQHLSDVLSGRNLPASSLSGGGAVQFGDLGGMFGGETSARVAALRNPPPAANDNTRAPRIVSDEEVRAIERAEKAYSRLIRTTEERIAQLGIEAEALGMTGYAADQFRNIQTLLTEAQATGVEMTPAMIEQITALGVAMTDAQMTLEGLHIALDNRSPWQVMAEEVARLNELMAAGKITASDYAAELGKSAEAMASKYAAAATGIIGQAEKLTDALGLQGRQAFEVQKALSIANAVVSGGEAIIKSYNWGTTLGGPVGGAIAAGLAAAATAAQIAAIASSSYTSKSVPNAMGGGSSGAAAVPAAAQQPQQAINIYVHGSSHIRGLMDDLAEGINTSDAGDKFNVAVRNLAA